MDVSFNGSILEIAVPAVGTIEAINLANAESVSYFETVKRQPAFYDAVNSPNGFIPVPQYKVLLQTSGKLKYIIDMGKVSNQPTWTNDVTGAQTCVAAVSAAMP